MLDAISIALSGLNAQKQRLAASASNIANISTGGTVPTADPASPASTVYRPLRVSFTPTGEGGGVQATVTADEEGYSVIYDPESIHANEEGLVAVPNVDLATESVHVLLAKTSFKANLAVIKTQDELLGDLLDTLA